MRRLTEVIQLLSEIHRIIQTFAFPVFPEYYSSAFKNGAVQIFFVIPTINMFVGNFV